MAVGAVFSLGMVLPGCAVPQRPGGGKEFHLQEPQTKAWYWLYLPKDDADGRRDAAAAGKKSPLVMTFHGMKPFDNAHSQCREWQQEADRYGYVVCAPELLTPDLASPVPLNHVPSSLERDERAILAIMDEVLRTVDVDPNAVLVTSWSYGGYVAHYMLNRHPERFSCLAVKQSNFSADLLDPKRVPRYRDYKIAVFYTQNDFAICQRESQEAAVWYSRHGFDLTFAEFADKGHERTPSLAAAFFARACGIQAKTPPLELASLRVKELPVLDRAGSNVTALELPASERRAAPKDTGAPAPRSPSESEKAAVVASAASPYHETGRDPAPSKPVAGEAAVAGPESFTPWRPFDSVNPLRTRPLTPTAPPSSTASRATVRQPEPESDNPVHVRLSSTIGIAPLVVSYSAALPDRLRRKAYFLWTDTDEPISNGINGQLFLTTPGEHRIEVLVTTEDGQEYRAGRTVTVLERITTSRKSD
ncbi:MAG: PHB depolymerase family esterase [Planctomycetota bacterium]